jgi:hypothetical protein
MFPVTGTVTYQNAPVADADVTLSPASDDAKAKPARGKTDSNGKFKVMTYFAPGDDRAGALPGKYKVTVQKIPASDGIVDPYKPGATVPKNQLPVKYEKATTTPFEHEVSAAAKELPLELKD